MDCPREYATLPVSLYSVSHHPYVGIALARRKNIVLGMLLVLQWLWILSVGHKKNQNFLENFCRFGRIFRR